MQNIDKKALTSGIWYTFSNFVAKGLVFLTTPIFARLMSVSDFGKYSTFTTWQSLLLCILPLGLHSTITRASLDYSKRLQGYASSVAVASFVFTAFVYGIVVLFRDFFCQLFSMDMRYIHLMFLYMLVQPALLVFQGVNHVTFRYKTSTAITLISSVLSIGAAILLAELFPDQLLGRVVGNNGVLIVFCGILFGYLLCKGRAVKWEYIRYGLRLSLPMLPHLVSMYILGSSNKLIIQYICGDEAVAFYNIGFTCAVVISMLSNSANEAMVPWLFPRLKAGEFAKVKSVCRVYVGIFTYVTVGLLLIAPEIMLIIGGEVYRPAQGVLMPIMAGCCCQFIYTLYVNMETYLMKPGVISAGTMVTAVINVAMTFILVEKFGYEAAAYATMICYLLLLVFHYCAVRFFRHDHAYHNKFNFACALGVCLFGILIRFTYTTGLRLALIVLYVIASVFVGIKYRKVIYSTVKNFFDKKTSQ